MLSVIRSIGVSFPFCAGNIAGVCEIANVAEVNPTIQALFDHSVAQRMSATLARD
jgi:hypothetical protein